MGLQRNKTHSQPGLRLTPTGQLSSTAASRTLDHLGWTLGDDVVQKQLFMSVLNYTNYRLIKPEYLLNS